MLGKTSFSPLHIRVLRRDFPIGLGEHITQYFLQLKTDWQWRFILPILCIYLTHATVKGELWVYTVFGRKWETSSMAHEDKKLSDHKCASSKKARSETRKRLELAVALAYASITFKKISLCTFFHFWVTTCQLGLHSHPRNTTSFINGTLRQYFNTDPMNTRSWLVSIAVVSSVHYTDRLMQALCSSGGKIWQLTLLFADSYMSPSTFRAYATRFSMRLSFNAAGSGVGNMAWTLKREKTMKKIENMHLLNWNKMAPNEVQTQRALISISSF